MAVAVFFRLEGVEKDQNRSISVSCLGCIVYDFPCISQIVGYSPLEVLCDAREDVHDLAEQAYLHNVYR